MSNKKNAKVAPTAKITALTWSSFNMPNIPSLKSPSVLKASPDQNYSVKIKSKGIRLKSFVTFFENCPKLASNIDGSYTAISV